MKALSTDKIISKVCYKNKDIDIDIYEEFNIFKNEEIDKLENNTSLYKNDNLLVTSDVIVVLSIIKQIFIFIWFNS